MGIARRRLVKIALQGVAVLVLPAMKLAAPIVPRVRAIRSRFYPIPLKRLDPDDVRRPGRWGG